MKSIVFPKKSPEAFHFKHLDPSLRFWEQGPLLAAVQHDGHNERLAKLMFGVEADTSAVTDVVESGHRRCCCCDPETNIRRASTVPEMVNPDI